MSAYRDPYYRGRDQRGSRGSYYYLPPRRSGYRPQASRRRPVSRNPDLYTDYDNYSDGYPESRPYSRRDGYGSWSGRTHPESRDRYFDDDFYRDRRRASDNRGGSYTRDSYRAGERYNLYKLQEDYGDNDYSYGGGEGRRRAGTVILLTVVLLLLSGVSAAILFVNSALGGIEYQIPEPISDDVLAVSAADVLAKLPRDGTTGEELNAYHMSVYRREILNAYYSEDELVHSDSAVNILVMSGESQNSPADVIVLITVRQEENKVTFTSIMPETGVAYASADAPVRLSCAMMMGGPQLVQSTVQSLLGIKIDWYIMLDNESMQKLLDDTGSYMNWLSENQISGINTYIEAGGDGDAVIQAGGEYIGGRQMIMLARFAGAADGGKNSSKIRGQLLFDTVCSLNDASSLKLAAAFSRAASGCHTDLTKGQLFSMCPMIYELKGCDVLTDSVPADNEYSLVSIHGTTVMRLTDTDYCRRRMVKNALGIDLPDQSPRGEQQPVSDGDVGNTSGSDTP